MTFFPFSPRMCVNHCTSWGQIWQGIAETPNLAPISPYLSISGWKNQKTLIFVTLPHMATSLTAIPEIHRVYFQLYSPHPFKIL